MHLKKLVRTSAGVPWLAVDPTNARPRFWAAAWTESCAIGRSPNTVELHLRHIAGFYEFCDSRFGRDCLDDAFSRLDARSVLRMLETFQLKIFEKKPITSFDIQRWDSARKFSCDAAGLLISQDLNWSAVVDRINSLGSIRPHDQGRIAYARALPDETLGELQEVAHPNSRRNPFKDESIRWRNWLIVNLLLLAGLRRGELLLLVSDSLKQGFSRVERKERYWLNVTTIIEDNRRFTQARIKTVQSNRQVPCSNSLANLYETYLAHYRAPDDGHPFLLTSEHGAPLSARSVNKILSQLFNRFSLEARNRFEEQCGKQRAISPHDLRHTCATARYSEFARRDRDRELVLQRMRAFFGWSITSDMPDRYARAAIQRDLSEGWDDTFERRLRGLSSTKAPS